MHWNSFAEFIDMGGRGLYVWGSFGVTLLLMLAEPLWLKVSRKKLITRLRRRQKALESENPS